MNKNKELVKNTGIIALGKCGVLLIQFFLLPVYTSYLSTAEYGDYDYLATIGLFIIPLATMLFEESMFRFLIDANNKKDESDIITTTVIYIFISNIIISFLTILVTKLFKYNFIPYLIFYIVSGSMYNLALALARGKGRIKLYSLISVMFSGLSVFLNILFIVVFKWGLTGIMIGGSIAQLISAVYTFNKLKIFKYIKIKNINKSLLKEMFTFSYPLVPNSVSWSFVNLMNRVIIISAIGISANGIFSVSNKFPYLISVIYGFFYTAWRESAAKAINEEDRNEFYQDIYFKLKRFMFCMCLGLIACLPFCFKFLTDDSYNEAYVYIPLLVISMYYANLSGYFGGIFSAYKDTRIMGISTILSAILAFFVTVTLISFIGIWAAVLGNFVSNFITYIIRFRNIRKYIIFRNDYYFHILNGILLLLTIYSFYSSNFIVHLVCFVIVCIYSIIENQPLLLDLYKGIKNKKKY